MILKWKFASFQCKRKLIKTHQLCSLVITNPLLSLLCSHDQEVPCAGSWATHSLQNCFNEDFHLYNLKSFFYNKLLKVTHLGPFLCLKWFFLHMCVECYAGVTRHPVCCFVSQAHPQQDHCSCPLQGLVMFFSTTEIHLSAKIQSRQLGFLFGLEAWQADLAFPVWVGFQCPQLRHNLRHFTACSLPLWCRTRIIALAGIRQAIAKDKVCNILVTSSRYPHMVWWTGWSRIPSAAFPEGWLLVWIRQISF